MLCKVPVAGGQRDVHPGSAEADDIVHAVAVHIRQLALEAVVADPVPGDRCEGGEFKRGCCKAVARGVAEVVGRVVVGDGGAGRVVGVLAGDGADVGLLAGQGGGGGGVGPGLGQVEQTVGVGVTTAEGRIEIVGRVRGRAIVVADHHA